LLANLGKNTKMNSHEQDDVRRERELLKSEQSSHSNMIEELLRQVGMPAGDPCRSDYLNWLAQQRDPLTGERRSRFASSVP
jgi:hypothetical protein